MTATWAAVAAWGLTAVAMTAVSWAMQQIFTPDISEPENSSTYNGANDRIGNTISEDIPIARAYGQVKLGGNKLRFNSKDDADLRIINAYSLGEIEGVINHIINDIDWYTLTGAHTKTEYKGTRTQIADGRFTDNASAYRSMAYTAFTFVKNDQQIGYDPNIVEIIKGLKCAPLAGGANVFTRNPAVMLYDWYKNVEGYADLDLDLNVFKSLEALCDAIPANAGYCSEYPVNDDDHVKATTKYSEDYWPYYATNSLNLLTGSWLKNAWAAGLGVVANQRFHIDLGTAKIIKQIYYENGIHLGGSSDGGVQNFTLWGSNNATAFAELTYGIDTNWTELTVSQNTFDQHTESDIADPKYITVTNTTAYRYYAFKFADNYGGVNMGIRRIELQGPVPRYRFDYVFDTDITINDAKKVLWQAFNGRVINSQGKLKPVWDWDKEADGAGGIANKTVRFAFTEDNIIKDTITWYQPEKPNIYRIHFLDSTAATPYQRTSVEERDERDINLNGEVLKDETCLYIIDPDAARRRCKFKYNRARYTDYVCNLTSFSSASKLELYDLVTVTHSLPGWTTKQFLITGRDEDEYGRPTFTLDAYFPGVYDDATIGVQPGYASVLPNPYSVYPVTNMALVEGGFVAGDGTWILFVTLTFTRPNSSFWFRGQVWTSVDDGATYGFYGNTTTGEGFRIDPSKAGFAAGNTLYVKVLSENVNGVVQSINEVTPESILIYGKLTVPADVTMFSATVEDSGVLLKWNAISNRDLSGYEIKQNGVVITTVMNGTSYRTGFLAAGLYTFSIIAIDSSGNLSTTVAEIDIVIYLPSTPSPSAAAVGEWAVVTWADCKTSMPIAYYKVNTVKQSNSLRYTERINWVGLKAYDIIAVDIAGNESATGSTSLTVTALLAVTDIIPTGLTYAIKLALTYTKYTGFECVEIWASATSNWASAVKVGETADTIWQHNGLSLIATRYYWTRTRDIYGNYSAWYPSSSTSGVIGTTSANPTDYLTALAGAITEDELYIDLSSRIDLIDTSDFVLEGGTIEENIVAGMNGAFSGLSDVQAILRASLDSQGTLLDALETEIAGLTSTEWSATGDYILGKYVLYTVDSKIYRCLIAYTYAVEGTKTPGVDTDYWEEADSIAVLVAAIEDRVDVLEVDYGLVDGRLTIAESSIVTNADNISLTSTVIVGPVALVAGILETGIIVEDVGDVVNIDVRISQAQIEVNGANAEIILHAALLDGIEGRLSTAEIDINAAEASIILKASQADLDVLGGGLSVVEETLSAAELQWTVKLNGAGRVAGVGLMLGAVSSEFIILADKFQVVNPADTMAPKAVFTVGNINGVSAVGINGDLIVDGSILARNIGANEIIANVANIKDALITNAKIANATIEEGKIKDATITGAKIALATIENANIKDVTIETAKIKDLNVTTLKIAGNAVTNSLSVYTAAGLACTKGGAVTTIQSLAIAATGAPIFLTFSCNMNNGYGESAGIFYIYRDGTLIYNSSFIVAMQEVSSDYCMYCFNMTDAPAAGNHTYYIKYLNDMVAADSTVTCRSLMLMEIKK
jgi:hypothetical protein